MNLRGASIALIAVIAIVVVAFASRVPKAAREAPLASAKLTAGQPAPAFSVTTNHGPFVLADAKQPVLLEIFATWCPHCQRETEVMNDLQARYGANVAIVAVTGSPYAVDANSPGSQADVDAFAARFGLTYPVAYDPTLNVARAYISSGFPTLILIDRDHRVVWRAHGEVTEPVIGREIDALLANAGRRSGAPGSRGDAADVPKSELP